MSQLTRRELLKVLGAGAALGLSGFPLVSFGAYKARVLVIGGGYGGATVAKYLRLADPRMEVTLLEKDPRFVSCALSNEVLAGERKIESLSFGYEALTDFYGVKVVQDEAVAIDPIKKTVATRNGQQLGYDRLVVAPGAGYKWGEIEGYDEAASQVMPHAWHAGEQTLLLRRQLESMEDGGTVYIVAPPNPYKCPPGPYERAALIAHYLKEHWKSRSKVIILDAKDAFAKEALFKQGWAEHYPGMITWVPGAEDGRVVEVDPATRTLYTEFDEHKGDVVNVIPPQKAGPIAEIAGLTDETGWCPVDQQTFESTIHPSVHVIGDACIAGDMPKSAYAANTQAKVCAAAIVALVDGTPPPTPSYVNTCYSILAPKHGLSVAGVYRLVDGRIQSVEGSGGVSSLEATSWEREMEAVYARSWFDNITADIFR